MNPQSSADQPDPKLPKTRRHAASSRRSPKLRSGRVEPTGQSSELRESVEPTVERRSPSPGEAELAEAMVAYKAASGRMFPTWSEVLEVLQKLGYQKTFPQA